MSPYPSPFFGCHLYYFQLNKLRQDSIHFTIERSLYKLGSTPKLTELQIIGAEKLA